VNWMVPGRRMTALIVGGMAACALTSAFADDWPSDTIFPQDTALEMVPVPGGCYAMGDFTGKGDPDERPVHRVCVKDFVIGKYPVSQFEWIGIMGRNPSAYDTCEYGMCPVENVSWNDVQEFLKRLNARSSAKYRLPTEAEWEYAARSGGRNEIWAGTNDPKRLVDFAWFAPNAGYQTHRVGTKKPNGLGLYDMTGNVWQWTADWYAPDYYESSPEQSPTGPPSGSRRVLRGGFWGNLDHMVRTARRIGLSPDVRSPGYGFRLVQIAPD